MAKVQKTYAKEFKEEAIRLAQASGKPITQIARELGISDTSIHPCRKGSEHLFTRIQMKYPPTRRCSPRPRDSAGVCDPSRQIGKPTSLS
jgi:hypothetical protein